MHVNMKMEEKRVVTKKQLGKKHLWKPEEDLILKNYVETHGEGNWATVSQQSGLMRGGKSCRLRWKNYLRPNIKRGGMSNEEQDLIIRMHKLLGNRWSLIAGRLPGRTDNEVKNYWNTHMTKRCQRKEMTKNTAKESETETETKKNRTEDSDLTLIISESHKSTARDEAGERKEEGDGTTTLLSSSVPEPVLSFNHMESPVMTDQGSLLFFDDEPYTNYVDSLMFLGAFGCPIFGENYADIAMQ